MLRECIINFFDKKLFIISADVELFYLALVLVHKGTRFLFSFIMYARVLFGHFMTKFGIVLFLALNIDKNWHVKITTSFDSKQDIQPCYFVLLDCVNILEIRIFYFQNG